MVVQIHFTDAEIRQYLEKLGFVVEPRTFGRFSPAYHNNQEWSEYLADAVVIDGQVHEASDFFSNIIQMTVKQLVNGDKTPINEITEPGTRKTTVYISGKITGLTEKQAKANFERAEKMFIDFGYDVVNPMKLNHDHDKTWSAYMKHDITELCRCDMICMLPNWTESRGAVVEHTIAQMIGIPVFYEAELSETDVVIASALYKNENQ